MKIVEVTALSKTFQKNSVLSDINFSLEEGTFMALLGKNGSGKSTVLNILMGNEKLDSGECFLFGKSIKDDPAKLKNLIGHVSENVQFDYPVPVETFLKGYGKLFNEFDYDFIEKTAKTLKIPLNKQFSGYSRGQKMQIVLLAALAHKPKLLLIDEVTSVLDAFSRKFFMSLLKEFTQKGGSVLITTNIVNEVQYYCNSVVFLDKKKVKFQTKISDIPSTFQKIRIKDPNHSVLKEPGVIWVGINSDGTQSYIAPEEVYAKHDNLEKDMRAVTLEDLYIYHSQDSDK